MINKIIHQIWLGDKNKKPEKLMKTWQDVHHDWEYNLWDEEKIESFGLLNKKQYDMSPTFRGKADIARYEILYRLGGFFIDADSVCLKKIPDNFLELDFITTYENEIFRQNLLANGFIGSKKGNKILYDLINKIHGINLQYLIREDPWKATGPLVFTETVSANRHLNPTLLNSEIMLPEHFESKNYVFCDMKKFDKQIYKQLQEKYSTSISYQYWGSTKGKY